MKDYIIIQDPIFNIKVLISARTSPERFMFLVKKKLGIVCHPESGDFGLAWQGVTVIPDGDAHYAMWFRSHNPQQTYVIHECLHGTEHVKRFLDIKDEEFAAYYQGYLIKEVNAALKKLKQAKKGS